MHIVGVHEFFLPVSDVNRSSDWYQNCFGMNLVEKGEKSATLMFEEGPRLTLMELGRLHNFAVNPIMFKAYDAQECHRQLRKLGVSATEPEPFHHYWCFEFTDPDGNPIDVTSEREEGYEGKTYLRVGGNFFVVKDIDASIQWYRNHLGAEIEYDFTMDAKVRKNTRAVTFANIPMALVEAETPPLLHMQCVLRTTNAEADYETLRSQGVRTTDLAEADGRKQFRFYDNVGHEIGMIQL